MGSSSVILTAVIVVVIVVLCDRESGECPGIQRGTLELAKSAGCGWVEVKQGWMKEGLPLSVHHVVRCRAREWTQELKLGKD